MNNSDDQDIDFTYSETNGVVRIKPSEADYDYIYSATGKAFKVVLPGFILSSAMVIGAFLADHYLLTDEVSGGEMPIGTFLFLAAVVLGSFLFMGSMVAFPMIRDAEKKERTQEVMNKCIRKHNQIRG